MFASALTRYQREVTGGAHFTMEKQERVEGKPRHPEMPVVEVIDAWVRGDVPDAQTKKTSTEVVMKWQSGAKKVLFAEVRGSLYSEKPKSDGGLEGKAITWRPNATFSAMSMAINELVVGQSDLVIAGGCDTMNDIFMYMCFSKTPALSPSGNSKPFSNEADGTILGEGVGMLVLKPVVGAN